MCKVAYKIYLRQAPETPTALAVVVSSASGMLAISMAGVQPELKLHQSLLGCHPTSEVATDRSNLLALHACIMLEAFAAVHEAQQWLCGHMGPWTTGYDSLGCTIHR
jgi:hypothetical protein